MERCLESGDLRRHPKRYFSNERYIRDISINLSIRKSYFIFNNRSYRRRLCLFELRKLYRHIQNIKKILFQRIWKGSNYIILQTPFTGNSYGGYLNWSRAAYVIDVEVYFVEDNTYIPKTTFRIRPFSDGTFKIDIAAQLRRFVNLRNEYVYDVINESDINISGGFNFRIREQWRGNIKPFSQINDRDMIYIVNAAQQLRDMYGVNMGEYVPVRNIIGPINGDFTIATGWTLLNPNPPMTAYLLIQNSNLYFQAGTSGMIATATSDTVIVNGESYDLTYEIISIQNMKVRMKCGTQPGLWRITAGVFNETIVSNGTSFAVNFEALGNPGDIKSVRIKWIEVKKTTGADIKAKFLMGNYEPTYFTGYPFDLSFIYSDEVSKYHLYRERKFLNINKSEISTSEDILSKQKKKYVNRLLIDESDFPANTKFIDVWIEMGLSAYLGAVDPTTVEVGTISIDEVKTAITFVPDTRTAQQ